jgi:hypothetical protein
MTPHAVLRDLDGHSGSYNLSIQSSSDYPKG